MDATEAINVELESQLLADPTRNDLWMAYAAWLKERGDARGELIEVTNGRVQAREYRIPLSGRGFQILTDQWSRWLGDLDPHTTATSWQNGFVYELYLSNRTPSDGSCRALFQRHALRFLRLLEIGPKLAVTLEGLDQLPVLSRLKLNAAPVPTLRSLCGPRPRSLTEVEVIVANTITANELRAVTGIPWLEELSRLRVGPLGVDALEHLLTQGDRVRALGSRVVLIAEEEGWAAHRAGIRTALPEATLQSIPRRNREGFTWVVTADPRWAPANFRDMPAIEEVDHSHSRCREGCCYTTERVGSGVSFENVVATSEVSRCMACASEDTRVIQQLYQRRFDRREHDTYNYERIEYECKECGKFSSYSNRWIS